MSFSILFVCCVLFKLISSQTSYTTSSLVVAPPDVIRKTGFFSDLRNNIGIAHGQVLKRTTEINGGVELLYPNGFKAFIKLLASNPSQIVMEFVNHDKYLYFGPNISGTKWIWSMEVDQRNGFTRLNITTDFENVENWPKDTLVFPYTLPFYYFRGLMHTMNDNTRLLWHCAPTDENMKYRAPTGICNNAELAVAGFAARGIAHLDKNVTGSAPSGQNRPNSRVISNMLANQGSFNKTDEHDLNLLFVLFGQFIDHDIVNPVFGINNKGILFKYDLFGTRAYYDNQLSIKVPKNDPTYSDLEYLELSRAQPIQNYVTSSEEKSPRETITTTSSFFDLSQVYGQENWRFHHLRSFIGGKLAAGKTSLGKEFLPLNNPAGIGYIVGTGPTPKYYIAMLLNPEKEPGAEIGETIAGDVRANEQPILTSLHSVWLREHNKVCDELAALFPDWQDEMLYQEARNIVIAEFQNIVYEEWLPTLLGKRMPKYAGYNPKVDVHVMDFFSTVAFRLGHSMVTEQYTLINFNGGKSEIQLRDFFFNSSLAHSFMDPLFRGAITKHANRLDLKMIDSLRSHLFKKIDFILGLDLFAANIERGRDLRVPDYNTARVLYGLSPKTSFDQISSDPSIAAALQSLYTDINNIDSWVGALAEDHLPFASCGELVAASVAEQFSRLRDGDRFFYKNMVWSTDIEQYKRLSQIKAGQIRLADILRRNTQIETPTFTLPKNVFVTYDF